MARIIPRGTAADTVSVAERLFLTAAVENLDDNYVVFHSIPWLSVLSRQLKQGECDFLILHPLFGMLSIEVKPGDVFCDGQAGVWRRSDGSDLGKDPYLQAQRSAHTLNSLLRQSVSGWAEAKMACGYAVHFSGADRIQGRFPPHASLLITLLHGDLRQLQDRLENIARHFGSPQAKPQHDLIRRAIDRLRPEFQLIQTFSTQLQTQEQGLQRLTRQQIQVLDLMRESKRLLIRGCAGSGKTLLALEKAARLARDGQRVLLLCFNIPLAEWLRSRIDQEQLAVDVFHFHGLCEHIAKAAGLEFSVPADGSLLSDFFDHKAPDLFARAVGLGVGPRYDAVIVDEGQDFIAEWWLSIDELLTDPRDGTMYVFYDPEQNIFNRDFGFLVGEAKLTLDKNCRNTHQIASYVNRLSVSKHEPADFAVEGPLPVERSVNSADSEAEEAERIIDDLVHQKGLAPNRIVIVGRRRLQNSPFAECAQLAGIPLIDESAGTPDDAAIRYATIYRFKGLEADCVILSGFSRPKVGETQSELYCAASRAKLMLYALYRTDRKGLDPLQHIAGPPASIDQISESLPSEQSAEQPENAATGLTASACVSE